MTAVCAGDGYTSCHGRASVFLMHLLAAELHSTTGFLYATRFNYICTDLGGRVFDGVGLAGFKSMDQCFFAGLICSLHFGRDSALLISLSPLSFSGFGCGVPHPFDIHFHICSSGSGRTSPQSERTSCCLRIYRVHMHPLSTSLAG